MNFIKLLYNKTAWAIGGLWYALKTELSVQLETLGLLGLLIFLYFVPQDPVEVLALLILYGFIIHSELKNTALELALDKLHPMRHEKIGHSKDVAAGAVLLSIILFALVFIYVLIY